MSFQKVIDETRRISSIYGITEQEIFDRIKQFAMATPMRVTDCAEHIFSRIHIEQQLKYSRGPTLVVEGNHEPRLPFGEEVSIRYVEEETPDWSDIEIWSQVPPREYRALMHHPIHEAKAMLDSRNQAEEEFIHGVQMGIPINPIVASSRKLDPDECLACYRKKTLQAYFDTHGDEYQVCADCYDDYLKDSVQNHNQRWVTPVQGEKVTARAIQRSGNGTPQGCPNCHGVHRTSNSFQTKCDDCGYILNRHFEHKAQHVHEGMLVQCSNCGDGDTFTDPVDGTIRCERCGMCRENHSGSVMGSGRLIPKPCPNCAANNVKTNTDGSTHCGHCGTSLGRSQSGGIIRGTPSGYLSSQEGGEAILPLGDIPEHLRCPPPLGIEPECQCEKPWNTGHDPNCNWKKWKDKNESQA